MVHLETGTPIDGAAPFPLSGWVTMLSSLSDQA
jgi:hypothetical protein